MRGNAGAQSNADDDSCVLQTWHEWDVKEGERRIILCVETTLELRPGYSGFDTLRLERLIEDATDLMRTSASPIDALRIMPARSTL
jgi:hypothetical protein